MSKWHRQVGGMITGLAVILIVAACAPAAATPEFVRSRLPRERQPEARTAAVDQLVADNTAFAFDLYYQAASQEEGNFIFSPYSISMAFAMVYAGARGESEQEIAETLHFTLPPSELHAAFNTLGLGLERIGEESPNSLKLTVANAVWGQQGFTIEQDFLDVLGQNYDAGLQLLDFAGAPGPSRDTINRWVSDQTEDRIPELVSPDMIRPDTRLVLTNAVYFKAHWISAFDEERTQEQPFTLRDGSEVGVQMMSGGPPYVRCMADHGYTAVELGYGEMGYPEGGPGSTAAYSTAMLLIIPEVGQFDAIENKLDASVLREITSRLVMTNAVNASIPRFEFESNLDLVEALRAMGMSAPFDISDFEGITPGGGLSISDAVHSANITVNEWGTEAAAATAIAVLEEGMENTCEYEVIADRPFIFTIYDRTHYTLLFLGRVLNPAQ